MGTQIVRQDSVCTENFRMGAVCFDKLRKAEFTECRSEAEIMSFKKYGTLHMNTVIVSF